MPLSPAERPLTPPRSASVVGSAYRRLSWFGKAKPKPCAGESRGTGPRSRRTPALRTWLCPLLIALSLTAWEIRTWGADPALVRIGYQKYGTLNIVRAQGSLEKALTEQGKKVQWLLFPAGPQLLEALNAGSIDVGNTGEAPPIFAEAANPSLVYLGNQPPFPEGEALLVPKSSSVNSVGALKGKKVVLNKGSNVHYFLVKALEQAGLKYTDVQTVFLAPPEARAAFEGGSVDAWAIWDPFLTAAQQATGARVLATAKDLAFNREFFLSTRNFVEKHPDFLPLLVTAVDRAAQWATDKPSEVAQFLAKEVGMPPQILESIIRREPWGFRPVSPTVVADQQAIADLFFLLKLIPKPIRVADAVPLTPADQAPPSTR